MDFLFCPSENCFNVPIILYLYNPLKNEVLYKCECDPGHEKKLELHEFLEKSCLICLQCRKAINDSNILFCKNCNNLIHFSCQKTHYNNKLHNNFQSTNINNILSFCQEHQECFMFRCMNCNKSLCHKCDLISHDENFHSLKQLMEFKITKNDFDIINNNFQRQKTIFEKIKNITKNLISNLENDIKMKQKIINNYINNKSNFPTMMNIQNLFFKNNQKYESILLNSLKEHEQIEQNHRDNFDINNYVEHFLLPIYYSMMINQEESLNDSLIKCLEDKINILKSMQVNNININNNIINAENQELYNQNLKRIILNTANNLNLEQKGKEAQNISSNKIKMNSPNAIIQKEEKNNNNEIPFSNRTELNNQNNKNTNLEKMKQYQLEKKAEKMSQNLSDIEKPKQIKAINEKNNQGNPDIQNRNNLIVNNMIELESGHFAISIQKRVEIYNFRCLNYSDKKNKFGDDFIKKHCLIQKINLEKWSQDNYINYIFQFFDKTLLCSTFSKIIQVKLKNDDKNHEVIGCINLENMELPKKLISLGKSMLAVLLQKDNNCYVKIYSKKDNLNYYNILNKEFDSICEEYSIFNNNIQNNDNLNKENKNIQKNNENCKEINLQSDFEMILDNINENNKFYISMFEIKKLNNNNEDKNKEDNTFEFILTSNAKYNNGGDKIVFYLIKKILGKSFIKYKVKELDGISCSIEPDTICQLDEKYLFIGLQNYGKPYQHNGFALINIVKRECSKIFEDKAISSLNFIQEKNMLFTAKQVTERNNTYYLTNVYQVLKNSNIQKDEFLFKNISENINKNSDIITSICPIFLPNYNKKIIFVTLSKNSNLEIIYEEIKN